MTGTDIRPCDCTVVHLFPGGCGVRAQRAMVPVPFNTRENGAKFQDERYGKGLRVHNLGIKKAACTVCGKEKGL